MTTGIGEEIRSFLVAFYADNGLLQLRDLVHLQAAADILVGLFECAGLKTNTSKTQAMVYIPGKVRTCQFRTVNNQRMMGEGEKERYHGRRVRCDICGEKLSARLLRSHLASQHDIHSNVALSADLLDKDRPPKMYLAEHPFEDGLFVGRRQFCRRC